MSQDEFDLQQFAASFHRGDDDEILPLESPLGLELAQFYRQTTKLPNPNDAKLLASYTMLPSMFCKVVPVLVLKGSSGSGKSQLLTAMAKLLDTKTVAGSTTAASVKNVINRIRWADPETMTHEKNCHFLMDNVNSETFGKDELLGCFLNGYSRETDRQYISIGKGENIEFRTFCPKAITTVWDIESPELLRRVLLIRTAKSLDLEGIGDEQPLLATLKKEVSSYWTRETCNQFVTIRRSLRWSKKFPINKEQFVLIVDLVTSGLVSGVWHDLEEALSQFATLFSLNKGRKTLLDVVIVNSLESLTGVKQHEWLPLSQSITIQVAPKHLKQSIETAVDNGEIIRPTLAKIQEVLGQLGFVPAVKSQGIVYQFHRPKDV